MRLTASCCSIVTAPWRIRIEAQSDLRAAPRSNSDCMRWPRSIPQARAAGVAAVAAQLNDYTRHMPAPERLALMDRLRELERNVFLPTQDALRLSLETLGAERLSPVPNVIRQTAVPDIWALTSQDTRVIALYRTGRLEAMMHDFLHQITSPGHPVRRVSSR